MTKPGAMPRFRALTRKECDSLLRRSSVGRVAFRLGNRVDIIPIHYVFRRGVVCGRTARETHLEEASANFNDALPVAFETDEVDGPYQWRSVVVHGNLHAAAEGEAEWRRAPREWQAAMRAFRTLMPDAFTADDPAAFRDILIRIDAAEVSGREALPGTRKR